MSVSPPPRTPERDHLVGLLGESRGRIVEQLRRSPRSVGELADAMGLSEVAVRRHLSVLERDGLVTAETVRRLGPGRPCAKYHLTDRGRRLFPDQSAQFACELLEFLEEEHGRSAVLRFFQWRQSRHADRPGTGLAGLLGEDHHAEDHHAEDHHAEHQHAEHHHREHAAGGPHADHQTFVNAPTTGDRDVHAS